jgi:uncharacterized protein (TIGR00156 family)
MKRALFFGFLAIVFSVTGYVQAQGFVGASTGTTVAEANRMRDDRSVVLTGYIVRHIREDYYLFRDDTGEIRVEIDRRAWGGLNVSENDLIEIRGEIDRDWYRFFRRTVEVRSVRLANRPDVPRN